NPQPAGQRAHAPVGGVGRSRLQRGVQDLLLQLGGQDAPRSLALLRLAQSLEAAAAESRARGQNRRARQPGLLSNRVVGNPLAGQQNRLTRASHPLRGGTGPSLGLQLLLRRFIDRTTGATGYRAPTR